jgi:hypothetical protein
LEHIRPLPSRYCRNQHNHDEHHADQSELSIPLLAMSMSTASDSETITPTRASAEGSGPKNTQPKDPFADVSVSQERRVEYRSRVDELAASIPDQGLEGGKHFNELSLYEKKSVLVNRELE